MWSGERVGVDRGESGIGGGRVRGEMWERGRSEGGGGEWEVEESGRWRRVGSGEGSGGVGGWASGVERPRNFFTILRKIVKKFRGRSLFK